MAGKELNTDLLRNGTDMHLTHAVDLTDSATLSNIQTLGDVWVKWHHDGRTSLGTIDCFMAQETLDPRMQMRIEFVRVKLPCGERVLVNPASLILIPREAIR